MIYAFNKIYLEKNKSNISRIENKMIKIFNKLYNV